MKKLNLLLPLILIVLTAYSCGNRTVEPFQNLEGYYSVYGALSVGTTNNYIRLRRLDTPLLADSAAFEGRVLFENLGTNTVTELEAEIVEFNGNYTHNFRIEEPIEPESQYRLSIEDKEGNITESTSSTPAVTGSSYSPTTDIYCNTSVNVVLSNIVEPEKVIYEIGFMNDGKMNWDRIDLFNDEINYNYTNEYVSLELSPKNFLVEVFTPPLPDNPYLDPFTLSPTVNCFQVDQKTVYIRYYHLSEEWAIGLPYDLPPLQIETEVIENGIGFLGGYYTNQVTIPFSP